MEKQISIIIPTYNMENYIGKCLDSLLIPNLDAVEIFVVNDGSKDKSSEIAHQYAERFPQSIRVIDKENGNYGSCINAALPLISGRYVKILDADDYFAQDAFEEFVDRLPDCKEDVLITNFTKVDSDGNLSPELSFSKSGILDNYVCSMCEVTDSFFQQYVPMHRLTYNAHIFSTFDYHQTEGISYTDTQWATFPLAYCNSIRFIDLYIYIYFYGRPGQTVDIITRKKSVPHFLKATCEITYFYEKNKDKVINRRFLFKQVLGFHDTLYRFLISLGSEYTQEIRHYDENLKLISPEIYDALGHVTYDPNVKYKIFSELRRLNYKDGFTVPRKILFKLSIKCKLRIYLRKVKKIKESFINN